MIPSQLAVDSSVFAAATLSHEQGHHTARTLMRTLTAREAELVVPALLIPEVMSALQRTRYPLARIRQLILAYRATRMIVTPVDLELADEAGEIAVLQGTRGSDSVFLALARLLGIPLVTLDREQRERAPADVEVFTPEEALAKWWPE
jgi:predicted nucleic acid-binding protein